MKNIKLDIVWRERFQKMTLSIGMPSFISVLISWHFHQRMKTESGTCRRLDFFPILKSAALTLYCNYIVTYLISGKTSCFKIKIHVNSRTHHQLKTFNTQHTKLLKWKIERTSHAKLTHVQTYVDTRDSNPLVIDRWKIILLIV